MNNKEKRILSYREGMTLEDMVNETNEYVDAVILAFNANLHKQSELLLGEINKVNARLDKLETNVNLLLKHFNIKG